MKKILIALILLSYTVTGGYAQGIRFFKGTLAEARAEAAKENKYIFIDCFTIWCGPCNRMARDVFTRQDVGDYFNAHFICCKMDMEKGEGLKIAKDFAVHSYPTYLFLDASGGLEHRTLGSKEPAVFIADGQTADDPTKNLHGLTERFNNHDGDTAMLHQLIGIASGVDYDLSEKALSAYWGIVKDDAIIEKQNWEMFRDYESDIDSRAFKYVLAHNKEFEDKFGAEEVDNTIYSKAAEAIRLAADRKDAHLYGYASGIASMSKNKDINITAGINTLRYYHKTGDWKKYISFADPFLKKYGDNQEIYNSVAWEIVANCNDQKVLEKALEYINESMKLDKNYGNSDTWANVLYKLKRYKAAKAAAEESIELAKKEKLDYTSTQQLLDKITAHLKAHN